MGHIAQDCFEARTSPRPGLGDGEAPWKVMLPMPIAGPSIFPRNTVARWGASHCCNPRCRVRSAADKAAMESFSDLQRKIVLSQRTWTTREQLCLAVVTWIEAMHHGSRRQDGLVGSTLLELGAIMLQ